MFAFESFQLEEITTDVHSNSIDVLLFVSKCWFQLTLRHHSQIFYQIIINYFLLTLYLYLLSIHLYIRGGMDEIWGEPRGFLNFWYIKTIDWTDSCCREDAVHRHIPDLAACSLSCLGGNEESVGSLICFHAGKNDFKEVDLSYPFLRSLLCQELNIPRDQSFEDFVSEHCFEDRLCQLEMMIHCWSRDLGDFLRDDVVISETKDQVIILSMLIERLDECLQILSDHEKLIQRDNIALTVGNSSDLIKVARFMSLSGENFDYSESVSHLTERVLSQKSIFCADLVPYKRRLDNMTSDLQRKLDFVLALKESPNLQADVVRKKKLSKEEILKFALSQECSPTAARGINYVWACRCSRASNCDICSLRN